MVQAGQVLVPHRAVVQEIPAYNQKRWQRFRTLQPHCLRGLQVEYVPCTVSKLVVQLPAFVSAGVDHLSEAHTRPSSTTPHHELKPPTTQPRLHHFRGREDRAAAG